MQSKLDYMIREMKGALVLGEDMKNVEVLRGTGGRVGQSIASIELSDLVLFHAKEAPLVSNLTEEEIVRYQTTRGGSNMTLQEWVSSNYNKPGMLNYVREDGSKIASHGVYLNLNPSCKTGDGKEQLFQIVEAGGIYFLKKVSQKPRLGLIIDMGYEVKKLNWNEQEHKDYHLKILASTSPLLGLANSDLGINRMLSPIGNRRYGAANPVAEFKVR